MPRLLRPRVGDEDEGSYIVELAVGSALMALAVLGIVGTMGSGMKIVANSRQRSAGTEVAQERLERARNIAYEDVALIETPTHNADLRHPDHAVSTDGSRFRLADGTEEPLIVDVADGGLKHVDDPFVLGTTEFSVHQYVTGVDDPAVAGTLDYKRVTVIVTWKVPQYGAGANTVVQSTFVGDGSITVAAASAPPTTTAPAPTVAPSASPAPTAIPGVLGTGRLIGPALALGSGATPGPDWPCPGDMTGPEVSTMKILSGSGTEPGYLNATTVQLLFNVSDGCAPVTLHLANKDSAAACSDLAADELAEVATVDAAAPVTAAWTIPGSDGPKGICAVFMDGNDQPSDAWGVDLYLDATAPAAPTALRHTSCTMLGTQRTIVFAWERSHDENLLGYRVYRSVDSTSYQLAGATLSPVATDVSLKSPASVRYVVKAYDKAGTESVASNVLSYAKNSC